MAKIVGVTLTERMLAGLVVDHQIVGPLRRFPENEDDQYALVEMPSDGLIRTICERVVQAADGAKDVTGVGVALPGLIKNGVVEDAPNLPQLKGARIQEQLTAQLRHHGLEATVNILNDADAMASGLAASIGKLDHTIRVWTLGVGIGYGRYPFTQSTGEGGHSIVSLDDRERFCGCGGRGHIEGIMGHRAMRLRFLDMEPEEVFEAANAGDAKCLEFKKLWHKALAAGTASSIHMDGPGKFFLTGFNVRFVDMPMLKDYLHQMVKMSPLQSYMLEIVTDDAATRVIGAAVAAEQAATR
ncbi:ROK family protein [Granulicella arctica]|uniref:Putative NBD/HSP70 family sugar kinase n=1 Tax=Granulicella arctica TaxID=940613 RepID=A0A7Y9TF63_9BACT|nr:ROK family protein [Granulicella arctica]NYF78401.1 putative NBD/HSP70 family sugar kinase [Granulicella arctica]